MFLFISVEKYLEVWKRGNFVREESGKLHSDFLVDLVIVIMIFRPMTSPITISSVNRVIRVCPGPLLLLIRTNLQE